MEQTIQFIVGGQSKSELLKLDMEIGQRYISRKAIKSTLMSYAIRHNNQNPDVVIASDDAFIGSVPF